MTGNTPTFDLISDTVKVSVTQSAGHMTAQFTLPDGQVISPYADALWDADDFPEQPNLLRYLRGDFFCLPFGPQEAGNPHGDTANEAWKLESVTSHTLTLSQSQPMGAEVKKIISTQDGHSVIYLEHQISGLTGEWNYGTHPILEFNEMKDGEARVATSAFDFGSTYPGDFAVPADGEVQSLQKNAPFTSLTQVPLAEGGETDLTKYPARAGYEDLIMVSHVEATSEQPFAWTAVAFKNHLWYALKKVEDFPSTLFWISNGGRPQAPWNGRHLKRMGLEDVCSHYCDSVDVSRLSSLTVGERKIPVTTPFNGSTVSLRNIQALAPIPEGFGLPVSLHPIDNQTIEIRSENGHFIQSTVDWNFIL